MKAPNSPISERDDRSPPQAHVRHHFGFSWIWLLPLGALGLVGYLVYSLVARRGPAISITFDTAEGLTAGETPVKYKAVTLGVVEQIELTDDLAHVRAKVRMNAQASSLLTEHARFWVVRPRLSGGFAALQSGLETLVSGAYVAVDPGPKGGKRQTKFTGLEKPPSTRSDEPGTVYFLTSDTLGGLGEGAPLYYRDVPAGEVLNYELDADTHTFSLRIFVRAPYDRHVVTGTRFWNSSGIRVDSGPQGLHVELQSIKSLLSGGIAFEDPPQTSGPASKPESTFRLYPSRAQAELGLYGPGLACVSYLQSSTNGLGPGSAVTLFGERIGSVTSVELVRDRRAEHQGELTARVGYVLEPARALGETDRAALTSDGIRALGHAGLRVVLESSSFLTGEKELALEYVPGAPAATLATEGESLVLPAESHDFQGLSAALGGIAAKINAIPFESIGEHVDHALASLDRSVSGPELPRAMAALEDALKQTAELAREAKADLGPALARLPAISAKLERAADKAQAAFGEEGYGSDSTTQRNLERMLDQIGDAARSVRLLADYLNRHPEALVSGRRENEP
jgi:paraquat-inducible protein B